jgi:hypothetical protein
MLSSTTYSLVRVIALAAAAATCSLTFGLTQARASVHPALGITHGVEHWNASVRPENGPHPALPIIPGGPRGRIAPDGLQFAGGGGKP